MSTTAKIILNSKTESGVGDQRGVILNFNADYKDGKNAEWAMWTPSLTVVMTVKGPVADKFVIGNSYTLTFDEDEVVVPEPEAEALPA